MESAAFSGALDWFERDQYLVYMIMRIESCVVTFFQHAEATHSGPFIAVFKFVGWREWMMSSVHYVSIVFMQSLHIFVGNVFKLILVAYAYMTL